jgi:hypothetical protein
LLIELDRIAFTEIAGVAPKALLEALLFDLYRDPDVAQTVRVPFQHLDDCLVPGHLGHRFIHACRRTHGFELNSLRRLLRILAPLK